MRTYSELSKLKTFKERYEYLKLSGTVGAETFGFKRHLNQMFYTRNPEWLSVRQKVIIRDEGNDLGLEGYPILSKKVKRGKKMVDLNRIIIHHLNPITDEMIANNDPELYNLDNLICTSDKTHRAIHYGNDSELFAEWKPRSLNDTIPWR